MAGIFLMVGHPVIPPLHKSKSAPIDKSPYRPRHSTRRQVRKHGRSNWPSVFIAHRFVTMSPLIAASNFHDFPFEIAEVNVDACCPVTVPKKLHVFAARVHAHALGVVISGYRFNDKVDNKIEVALFFKLLPNALVCQTGQTTKIIKGNPQWPQAFFPTERLVLDNGDDVLARCTYSSINRNRTTFGGASHSTQRPLDGSGVDVLTFRLFDRGHRRGRDVQPVHNVLHGRGSRTDVPVVRIHVQRAPVGVVSGRLRRAAAAQCGARGVRAARRPFRCGFRAQSGK